MRHDRRFHLDDVANRDRGYSHLERRCGSLDEVHIVLGVGGGLRIRQHRHSRHGGGDLLERLQPLASKRIFKTREPGRVAAWAREARYPASSDRVGPQGEHNRYRTGFPQEREDRRRVASKQNVGLEINEFLCDDSHSIEIARRPAIVGSKIATFHPAQVLHSLPESREPCATLLIGVSIASSHHCRKPPHSLALLRARRKRPRRRRAAAQPDDLAPPHSITSSASASNFGGTSIPSALAVLRLMTNSNLTGCITGSSAGGVPPRIRPTRRPDCRY